MPFEISTIFVDQPRRDGNLDMEEFFDSRSGEISDLFQMGAITGV